MHRDLCATVTGCVRVVDSLRLEIDRQNERIANQVTILKDSLLSGTALFTQDALNELRSELRTECAAEVVTFFNSVAFEKIREGIRTDVSVEISAATACAQADMQELLENFRREMAASRVEAASSTLAEPSDVGEAEILKAQFHDELQALHCEVEEKLRGCHKLCASECEALRQDVFVSTADLEQRLKAEMTDKLVAEVEAWRSEMQAWQSASDSDAKLAEDTIEKLRREFGAVATSTQTGREAADLGSSEKLDRLEMADSQEAMASLREDCNRANSALGASFEKRLEQAMGEVEASGAALQGGLCKFQEEMRKEIAAATEAITSWWSAAGGDDCKPARRLREDGGTGAVPGQEETAILIAHMQQIEDQVEALTTRVEEVGKSYQVQSQVVKELATKFRVPPDMPPSMPTSKRASKYADPAGMVLADVQDALRRFQGDVDTRMKVEALHRETLEARIHELHLLVKDPDPAGRQAPAPKRGRQGSGDAASCRGRSPQGVDTPSSKSKLMEPPRQFSRSPSRPSSLDARAAGSQGGGSTAAGETQDQTTPQEVHRERQAGSSTVGGRLTRPNSQASSVHAPGVHEQHSQAQSGASTRRSGVASSAGAASPTSSFRPLKGAARLQEAGVSAATRSSMGRQVPRSSRPTVISAAGSHANGETLHSSSAPRLITTA
eukprot:CAMPEP_0178421680 /NCGR_PEP_ID=MMETSP0689_2-20121128/26772_1 /TAXON_ID=160604 /ORGANISM="Amphidinium massartii, Strain CS-259" /LENGTH=670 /DNA_ID=CAMNT_0020043199 /DNA_START=1 /DNA_END=2009 /DNA_ORIENTATION=+